MKVARVLREYAADCEREGRYPSEAGLRLGVGEEEYRALCVREDTAPLLERARLGRVDWLESRITRGGAGITGLMSVLRREDAAAAEEARLIIRMEGLGGPEAAK